MSQIIGRRVVVVDVYDDGREVQRKTNFTAVAPPIENLKGIWTPRYQSKYEPFISELIRNGIVDDEYKMNWLSGSVSLIYCYYFLSEKGFVIPGLEWTDVYRAFAGTFTLLKIKHPRNLQDRNNKTKAYRDKEEEWRSFFNSRFIFAP